MTNNQYDACNRLFVQICGRRGIWQLFLRDGCLLLYRVGSAEGGIDESLVQSPASPLRAAAKGDFVLREKDAVRIRHKQQGIKRIIQIRMQCRYLELQAIQTDHRRLLNTFNHFAKHAHAGGTVDSDKRRQEHCVSPAYTPLRIANILLTPLAIFVLIFPVNRLLRIAVLPSVLMLYGIFPGEFTVIDPIKRHGSRYYRKPPIDISRQVCYGRINITLTLAFSSLIPSIGVNAYNIHDFKKQLVFAVIAAACLLALVMLFTFDWRIQKSVIATFAILLLLYSFGTVALLNKHLDRNPYVTENATIIDRYSSGGKSKSHTIRVQCASGEESYYVSLSQYEDTKIGDEVILKHHEGWLNIPYTDICLP